MKQTLSHQTYRNYLKYLTCYVFLCHNYNYWLKTKCTISKLCTIDSNCKCRNEHILPVVLTYSNTQYLDSCKFTAFMHKTR